MKFIFRILFLSFLAVVAAACATTTSPTPTAQPDAAVAPTEASVTSDQGYVPSDLSMVANTGRPQFLDSYADW